MTTQPIRFPGLILLALTLGACSFFEKAPGSSVVQFYNHSGRTVLVEDNELRANRQGTFNYPTESGRPLIVFWNGCVHTYIAPDRKPGEFRAADWMLRDAYRAQLEADGKLYLVPPGVEFPGDPATMTQPAGFPLPPREGSSCLQ
jgi:CobQ-like glutamine amidotransferase family enzyme